MVQQVDLNTSLSKEMAETAVANLRGADVLKKLKILSLFDRMFEGGGKLTLEDLQKKIEEALKDQTPPAT